MTGERTRSERLLHETVGASVLPRHLGHRQLHTYIFAYTNNCVNYGGKSLALNSAWYPTGSHGRCFGGDASGTMFSSSMSSPTMWPSKPAAPAQGDRVPRAGSGSRQDGVNEVANHGDGVGQRLLCETANLARFDRVVPAPVVHVWDAESRRQHDVAPTGLSSERGDRVLR